MKKKLLLLVYVRPKKRKQTNLGYRAFSENWGQYLAKHMSTLYIVLILTIKWDEAFSVVNYFSDRNYYKHGPDNELKQNHIRRYLFKM